MVSDLRSCTMLSTLPLFYIAQSVNSDDRRTRIQGLRVIMRCPREILGHVVTFRPITVVFVSPEPTFLEPYHLDHHFGCYCERILR